MKKAKQHTQELTGAVVRYTTNKHNDVDGLVLDQHGALVDIKFPPHTARFVRDVAAEGDTVQIVQHKTPHHVHLDTIENTTTHQQFSVESVQPPHPPETGRLIPFTIPKPRFTRGGKEGKKGKEAKITGVIFENNYIHLHPDEYKAGEDALSKAAVLHVKAKKRTADAGFVNADGYTVYHAHSINIGEK
jgi:hypothetical protein